MINWLPDLIDLAERVLPLVPDLTESELKLLCAATNGEIAYCGPSFDEADPKNDPMYADSWEPERSIRASLIRWLCDEKGAADCVQPAGIRIHACRIEEELDLSFTNVRFPLFLRKCRIVRRPNLSMAQIEALSLWGSVTPGMSADRITVRGSLALNLGFRAEGEVWLAGASIGGDLNCSGGRFSTLGANPLSAEMPYGAVLVAHGLNVGGVVSFSAGFCAEGTVVLAGGKIGGDLNCDDGHFMNPGGRAIIADGLRVSGAIFFRRATASGEVRLNGASVKGLQCARGRFVNSGGYALNADGIHVEGSAQLNDGFYSEGEVCFVGGSIAGNLECVRGRFNNPGMMAINGDHIRVGADILLRESISTGEVRLLGGKIGGSLECRRGIFLNPGGHAIDADRLDVAGDVSFTSGFRSVGVMHLRGAQIRGALACPGAQFFNPGRETLDGDGMTVGGSVLFHSEVSPPAFNEFRNAGVISLVGVNIRGNLEFVGSRFGPFSAVNARFATVAGVFYWKGVKRDPSLLIHIEDASVGSLEDDESSWPSPGNLHLDGFAYDRISSDYMNPDDRLRWLHLQNAQEPGPVRRFMHGVLYGGHRLTWRQKDWPTFRPQPYQQLARALREVGDNAGAKRVLVDMEDSRRKYGDLNFPAWIWRWLLKGVIGYGYYPAYALIWAFFFIVTGSALCWYNADLITPTDREAYQRTNLSAGYIGAAAPAYYPPFSPIVYSVDTFLPIINLGQKDRWMPNAYRGHPVYLPHWLPSPSGKWLTTGWLLRLWLWFHIGVGWLLTTLFVAGLTPIVRSG